jgi:peptidoglycan/LPS O-acetylase OafA/YrhL
MYLNYRPDIDGLRAIAVLSVIGFHAFGIQAGFIGVDIFFVISGYLIASILFNDLLENKFSILDFYRRRIRRIFPALLIVLVFCFALGWFTLLADEFSALNKHIIAGLAFFSNLVLLSESGYFDHASHNKILLHLWSLGIEEQFYIFWPLLLLLIWHFYKNIQKWTVLLGSILLSLLCISFIANVTTISTYPNAAFYLPFTRIWELLIGAMLAYRSVVQGKVLTLWNSPNLNAWLAFALLVFANIFVNDRSPFPGWWALLPTLCAALFIAAGPLAWFNKHILGSRILVWFGLISYPLYLWHWPLLTFARILDGGRQPSSAIRICMVLLAIFLAWLTYRFVEKPIRFNKNSCFTPIRLLIIGFTFFCICTYSYLSNGLPGRAAAQIEVLNQGDIGHDEFRTYLHAQPNYCEYKDETPNKCTDQFRQFKRVVAVVGDSHAEHILLGLTDDMPDTGFILFDTNQTLPFISSAQSNHFFNVIKQNSKIDTVILVAYWHLRKQLLTPENSYLSEIMPTVQKLSTSGKKVFLVDGTPNFSFPPTKCKYDWRLVRVQQCAESNRFTKQQSQYLPDFIQAANKSSIKLIELSPLFCDGDICTMAKDGKLFFRDDNHLNMNGSRLISPTLKSALQDHSF